MSAQFELAFAQDLGGQPLDFVRWPRENPSAGDGFARESPGDWNPAQPGFRIGEHPLASWRIGQAAKRALDVIAAGLLLIMASPVFLLMFLIIGRDGGPVFFGHERIGRDGTRFKCLKFRTMVTDANRALQELLDADPAAAAEWRETQKLRRDPRITPVGKYLRASSIDELPQLINILRGDMSLVGPRPIVDAEVDRYGDKIAYYLATRPGLTGPWQVSGRSDTTYASRVALDTHYVRNWSFWTDLAILVKTVPAVALRRGAV